VGYADHKPVESNDTPEGRSRNRRVTLMILENLSNASDRPVVPADLAPAV